MDVVLNELSILDGRKGRANEWYSTLFETCLSLSSELKTKINLVTTKRMSSIILDESMLFERWLSTITDREKRLAIISMVSKKPLIHEYPYYYYQKAEAKGLGYAYENKLLPLSFNNNIKWNELFLNIELHYINPESDEFKEDNLTIIHSWDIDSSSFHLNSLKLELSSDQKKIIQDIESGIELWNKREDLFSDLKFCDVTKEQISKLSGIILKSLCNRLIEMNNYFSSWNKGDFDKSGFRGDPRLESGTRETKFSDTLTIKCVDGKNRLFSFHCNYGTRDLRLHFSPDSTNRICHIGYIGKKIV